MIIRPDLEDFQIIGHYLGKVTIGIGLLMLLPFLIGLVAGEIQPSVDYLFSASVTLLGGYIFTAIFYTKRDLGSMHAMAVASLSWLVAMAVSAIPLYFSGHFHSFLDACFETMSGYATTGLSLANDLDHMAYAHNFWRHFIMFIGGQGIVVIALTFLFKGTAGAFKMYVGEARDERILPNIIETARFIWLVSLVYLVIGSAGLSWAAIRGGLEPVKAIFDSVCIFFAAWDTGGFTPQSQNILFYHNFRFEIVTMAIMLLGSINFALHYQVWTGNRKELVKNVEIRTFFLTLIGALSITAWGVADQNAYSQTIPFMRKTLYHLVSAHTGTGYSTVYPIQFVKEWGQLGMLGLTIAMAIGGSMCSTTGAIKLLRIGVMYKALRQDIKRLIIPESAVVMQKIHHIKDLILEDKHIRASAIILLSYINIYLLGTVMGMLYGYPLCDASFESVSAAANVGLSCGITAPSMPVGLKITYIFQMWAGRLEFISIFVLGGMILAIFKGKR